MRTHSLYVLLALLATSTVGSPAEQSLNVAVRDFTEVQAGSAVDGGWKLSDAGEVGCIFDFAKDGRYTFILIARGDAAAGEGPVMKMTVDGKLLAEEEVKADRWATYTFQGTIDAGRREVKVSFVNDFYDQGQDRNLYLRNIVIVPAEGTPVPGVISAASLAESQRSKVEQLLSTIDARIDRVRRARLQVRVLDASGRRVPNATVHVQQMKQDFLFGTALSSEMFAEDSGGEEKKRYLAAVEKYFNHAVTENALKWDVMQPSQEDFNDGDLNRIVIWCAEKGIPLRGHCVFWGCEDKVPAWARALTDDELRSEIVGRARIIARRYKDLIDEFDVNNEMLHCTYFKDRLGPSVHSQMFQEMKTANPEAQLYVNDFNVLTGDKLSAYVHQIRSLLKEGVAIDGIGLQAHFDGPVDVEKVQTALDTLGQFGIPIKITEFDCSSPDEKVQAETLRTLYRLAFAHPAVEGILMWGFWEKLHWKPEAAMLRKDFSLRPSARAYENLVLKEWRTDESGKTGKNGEFACRVYLGTLRIDVLGPKGGKLARRISLDSVDKITTVTLRLPPTATPGKKSAKKPAKKKAKKKAPPKDDPNAPMGW